MKIGFYPKLAWSSLGKSKKFNFPFILTAGFIIFAYYTMAFLSASDVTRDMPGDESFRAILNFGTYVILIFSSLFLFYTYSFLMKKRTKELGLYNILGLSKMNLIRILFWENITIASISIISGIGFGILFSKLMDLLLINMAYGVVEFTFQISGYAIKRTVISYCVIFGILFLTGCIRIIRSKTNDLLHGDNFGEKPPKANWILGIGGVIILAVAYFVAVRISDPLTAIVIFFGAVIMVIIATYLIFISGSVMFCKILQKNKSYYYKANHFVPVSSMAYRMKRNGAGLASICILLTMVLVTISSTSCLYFGADDAVETRYPRQIVGYSLRYGWSENDYTYYDGLHDAVSSYIDDTGVTVSNVLDYTDYTVIGYLEWNDGITALTERNDHGISTYANACTMHILSIDTYNKICNTDYMLKKNEALTFSVRAKELSGKLKIGETELTVAGNVPKYGFDGSGPAEMVITLFVFVNDPVALAGEISNTFTSADISFRSLYCVDTDLDEQEQLNLGNNLNEVYHYARPEGSSYGYADSRATARYDFVATYSALFFIGILLSLVFIVMAVLIIYYKQINEGYEDQSRFEIMKKVGMTREEIKTSINSQMRMVFILPIVFACLHLAFAFPFISKILLLFGISNQPLLIGVTAITVAVITVFYMVSYKLTTNVYLSIVSEARN